MPVSIRSDHLLTRRTDEAFPIDTLLTPKAEETSAWAVSTAFDIRKVGVRLEPHVGWLGRDVEVLNSDSFPL
jgi:hypothetical protein